MTASSLSGRRMPVRSPPRAKSARPMRRASASSSPPACSGSTCTICASRWPRPASSISTSRSRTEVAMVLLPHVVLARFQHAYAVYRAELGNLKPRDLERRRVGIRSFTTTTGAWLRGILANDYGVDLNSTHWVTFEDAHVAEFRDTTVRAPQGKAIIQMLLDGELDAVLGEKVERPGLKPLFADALMEEQSWFAKHQVVPINHMVVVSESLSNEHPEAVREVSRLLRESAALAPPPAVPRFNAEEMRRSLELIIQYTAQQGLIPRAFAVDELFDDLTRTLS